MRSRTRKIADMAIFIALGVVLNLCSFQSFGTYLGRISLVYLFCYLAGFFLGPWQGFAVAFIADLIPGIFVPTGPYSIMISISNATMALIAGCYGRYTGWKVIYKLLATIATSFVICTLTLTVIGEVNSVLIIPVGEYQAASLYSLYPYTLAKVIIGEGLGVKEPYFQMMLAKAVQQPLWIVLNSIVTYVIYVRLQPILTRGGYVSAEERKNAQGNYRSRYDGVIIAGRPSDGNQPSRYDGVVLGK